MEEEQEVEAGEEEEEVEGDDGENGARQVDYYFGQYIYYSICKITKMGK